MGSTLACRVTSLVKREGPSQSLANPLRSGMSGDIELEDSPINRRHRLSAIGLAGLAGYTVAQRTRELGARIALGARTSQIVRAILDPMCRPIASGFVGGAVGGAGVTRILLSGLPAMAGPGEAWSAPSPV